MSDKNVDTYETVMKSVTELVSKKKWSHLLAPLRKLTMFMHQVTIQDTLDLANCLPNIGKGNDERKVARLIHMIISDTYFLGTTEQKQELKNIMAEEIETPLYPRYASAIKVYITLLKDLNETSSILPALSGKLTEAMNDTHNKTGNASSMVTELFHCLFLSDLPLSTLKPYIEWGLRSTDLSVLRLSLGILVKSFSQDPTLCETLFATFIDTTGRPKSTCVLDTQTLLYFSRLCYNISKKKNCSDPVYLKGLCFALQYETSSVSVVVSVNEFFSLLPYDQVLQLDTTGNTSSTPALMSSIIDSLKNNFLASVEHVDQTLFLDTIRPLLNIIANVTKVFPTRSKIGGSPFYDNVKQLFDTLYQQFFTLISHDNLAIRCNAIQGCIWLVDPLDNGTQSQECNTLLETLKLIELPNEFVKEVFHSLHQRIECTPQLSYFSVLLSWAWLNLNPLSLSINDLTTGWKYCFNNRDDHDVTLTLEHIYKVLDLAVRNVDIEQYVSVLKTSCIWFLGECSSFFKPTTETANDSTFDPSFYYQSILLRLQKCALIGDWATRREAIRALGKIGIKAGEPVRITVYEMLKNLSEQSDDGNKLAHDLIDPILEMLDIIYTAEENKEDVTTLIRNQLIIFQQGDCQY